MQDAATSREDESDPASAVEAAAAFDYGAPADLFTRRNAAAQIAADTVPADAARALSRSTYRNALAYRRFASGAEALRHAIERLPAAALAASVVVADGERYEADAIRALYSSPDYPLRRRVRAASSELLKKRAVHK